MDTEEDESSEEPEDSEVSENSEKIDPDAESGENEDADDDQDADDPDPDDEAAWDEGIEDLPGVEEAWDSVVDDAPAHGGGEDLGERIEYDVSRGGVRRTLTVVATILVVVLALALIVAMLRNGPDDDPVSEQQSAQSSAPPPADSPEDAADIQIDPVALPEFTATLDEVVAVEAGSGPESERIVLDVPDSDLPAPLGTVIATLLFFDGSPQVLLTGPSRWLNSACIQTTVVSPDLDSLDAAYHDTPTGACGAEGIGRQSHVSCVGEDVIMLDVDLVDAGATTGSDRLIAESVRIALVELPDEFETLSMLGAINLPEGFSVTELPLARAPLGSELRIGLPDIEEGLEVLCTTR